MSDRSNRREVRNPVLALPAVKRLDELSPEARAIMADILGDLVNDARSRAQQSWAKNKGPMAAYWKAVGAYAHHFRRVVRTQPPQTNVEGDSVFPSKEEIHHLAKLALEEMQREATTDPAAWIASYERVIMAYRRLALSKQQASDSEAWERANEAVKAANALQVEVDRFRALYPSPETILMGIETAPKDGTWFIGYQDGEPFPCDWRSEEQDEGPPREGWFDFFNRSFEDPTHWLPVWGATREGSEP